MNKPREVAESLVKNYCSVDLIEIIMGILDNMYHGDKEAAIDSIIESVDGTEVLHSLWKVQDEDSKDRLAWVINTSIDKGFWEKEAPIMDFLGTDSVYLFGALYSYFLDGDLSCITDEIFEDDYFKFINHVIDVIGNDTGFDVTDPKDIEELTLLRDKIDSILSDYKITQGE